MKMNNIRIETVLEVNDPSYTTLQDAFIAAQPEIFQRFCSQFALLTEKEEKREKNQIETAL